jgi:general secretion pathway protein D
MKLIRFLLLAFFTLFAPSIVVAEKVEEETVQLNIDNMDIDEFIRMVAKIDNRNILIPLNVRGKINYISKKPIPKKNIFHLLQMILKDRGFTIIDSNKGYYIVSRISDAHKDSPDIKQYSYEDIIHTAFIKINNIDVAKISALVKNFLSRSGKLLISQETNSLVVTDLPENINTVRHLVKKLDYRTDTITEFVELKYTKASEVFTDLNAISKVIFDPKIEEEKVSIFKNDGTNVITLIGKKEMVKKMMTYIYRFDQPDKMSKQNIYFVKLNNASVEDTSKILTQVISKKVYKKGEARASIATDTELNSLVIIATETEYDEFLELIRKLDIERKQVYVKARIVEISEQKAQDIGVKYGIEGFTVSEGGLYSLSSSLNGGSSITSSAVSMSQIPSDLSHGFALGIGLSFLGTNGVANTLSEPSILCVNNQESSIYVGQTQSILTNSSTGASTTALTQNSYTREDIGLTLKIKPRISNDSKVILEVDTTLEDVVAGSGAGLPTTTKREVKTVAVVQDGGSVIVGGLIKNKMDEAESKIPLLGDIPLLGYLFKSKTKNKDKIHLVIMLTPYIVEKSEDLETLRGKLKTLDEIEKKVVKEFIKAKMMEPDELDQIGDSVELREDIDFDD